MKRRLGIELQHFKQLSFVARQILISSSIYELAYPILITFLSAFLFRSTGGFLASALFNIGLVIGIPVGFYANGLLLKRINIKWLFMVGLVGQGLIASLVFFLGSVTPLTIFIIGFLQGFPMGLYFGNRNFITFSVTKDGERSYYTGLEQIIGNIAGVISPFITGWLLVFGSRWSALSLQQVYQLLAVVATLGLLIAAKTLFAANISNPPFKKLWLGALQSAWNKGRIREILFGMENGIKILIPPLLILYAVGQEGTLGSLQSGAAVVSSLVLYTFARKIRVESRKSLLVWCVFINLLLALPLALHFSTMPIVFFLVTMPTLQQLFWLAFHPMQLQIIDEEEGGDPTNNYAYVVDREMFLNIGRIIGMVLFLLLFTYMSDEFSLRFTPLVTALAQLGFLALL